MSIKILLRSAALVATMTVLQAAPARLENQNFKVSLQDGGAVEVTALKGGANAVFAPEFTLLFSEQNPNMELRWGKFSEPALQGHRTGSIYNIPTWGRKAERRVKTDAHVEDGADPMADRGYGAGRTANLFAAASSTTVRAQSARVQGQEIVWEFDTNDFAELHATLDVPSDGTAPRMRLAMKPKKDGWYSLGMTGAPATQPSEVEELWQPLIYNERRMPEESFLELAFRCPLPTAFVTRNGVTTGVVADPAEYPFQPMPDTDNSRFGVAVRNAIGQAQAMLFAPVLGGKNSQMKAGTEFAFALRLHVSAGAVTDAYEQLARGLFGFRDVRHNALGSLNSAFEKMIDVGLSEYARFNADLRGFAYDTDVPGSVKNISSLHTYSIALVTDNARIFHDLARPQMEASLSRERFLFTIDPAVKGQSASSRLSGLGAPLSEFATLYALSGKRTPAFLGAAEQLFGKDRRLNLESDLRGDSWGNSLALYRATGDREWLRRAVADADEYLKRRVAVKPAVFADRDSRGMFFWPSFVPQWMELFELYEETGEKRFLEAAHAGARDYTRYVWMSPSIPPGEVLVNEGGVAPAYRVGPKVPRIKIAEETVPAWRVSEIGLTPEGAGTSKGARGIFLACYAPWMLRIASLTNDTFLHDVARSAIIGRYTSFPGYHMNTARTTVYEKENFIRRSKDELNSTTSIHYNHIWAQIALLMDYLVTDAYAKSGGKVDFPSRYAEGYGYVQQKIYGDRPGRVYDVTDLTLWMPLGVIGVEHPELNYIVARGKDTLALVFTNQSKQPVRSAVKLNATHTAWSAKSAFTLRDQWGKRSGGGALSNEGSLSIEVPAEGVVAVIVTGVAPKVSFQNQVAAESPQLSRDSVVDLGWRDGKAFGISFGGRDLTSVYTYVPDFGRTIKRCTLRVLDAQGRVASEIKDEAYPYDFTIPAGSGADVRFTLEVETTDGVVDRSPVNRVSLR
jgi:hypothetical protein